MGPRINISYCYRVHIPVHEAWRSQENHTQQIPLVITIQKRVYFDLSMTYRFVVIEEKVKGQIFGSTGVKQVNIL